MSARGVYCAATADSLTYVAPSQLFTPLSDDFAICGWHRIHGTVSVNFVSNFVGLRIYRSGHSTQGAYFVGDSNGTPTSSPFPMMVWGTGNAGSPSNAATTNYSTGQDWFECIVYSHATDLYTYYYGLDGATSLTSITSVGTTNHDTPIDTVSLCGDISLGGPGTPNGEMTNVKAWAGTNIASTFNAAAFLAEMKRVDPVISANLYAHWKLANSSDLTDYSGNGRTLTANGSVTNGSMNPLDLIQAKPITISKLRITH